VQSKLKKKQLCEKKFIPQAGSPTSTLCQLHSNN